MRPPTFEVCLSTNGHSWFWHEKASNGKIKDVSQLYSRKASAKRAALRKVAETPGAKLVVA